MPEATPAGTPYKDAALRYMTHGWSPLPVGNRPGEKTPPPTGWTGSDAPYPTEDQIAEWVDSHPDRNIGIRMPDTVIGIDVDGYDDKPGVFTMKAAAERHGKLPATWVSTSRSDMSGIRWFAIPTPQKLPGKLIHPDNEDQSGVEVIQRHHRFAVVPPSIHPSGRRYQWITPEGQITDNRIPTKSDLPLLPQPWLEHIGKACSCWATFDWERYKQGNHKDPVADAYEKWSAKMTSNYGRHDAALGGVMALTAFAHRDWPGAEQSLDRLEADFYASLGDSRDDREAKAEWARMLSGARAKAHTTTIPQWESHTTPEAPSTPEEVDQAVEDELHRLRVRDRARQLFEREKNPPTEPPDVVNLTQWLNKDFPDIEWRINYWQPTGTRVLLAAQYKAGKTTLTGNLARSLADGDPWLGSDDVQTVTNTVTILDFEMGARQVTEWLRDQRIENPHKVAMSALRGKASTFSILDDKTRSEWARKLAGTEYLILDCLRPVLDALGLDEHTEGGRFLTAFDELCDEAGIIDALVVHHMGHSGERSRGDSRFRDWPDVEWRLVRQSEDPWSTRFISAYGRDVEQPESQLIFNDRRLTIQPGINRNQADATNALPDVVMWLGNQPTPQSKRSITSALTEEPYTYRQKQVRDAIDLGISKGELAYSGGGAYPPIRVVWDSSKEGDA